VASFEVRVELEILAGGRILLRRGPEKKYPRVELAPDEHWRKAAERFTAQQLGELPGHAELVDVENASEGLLPLLLLKVCCYLPRMNPPQSGEFRWARIDPGAGGETPGGGTLDPDAEVRLYTDGGSRGNPGPAGIGVLLCQEHTDWAEEFCEYIGAATNNRAEYVALLKGLRLALQRGVKRLEHRSDSQLIVRQLEGSYKVKSPELKELHKQALELAGSFASFRTVHVPREQNRRADELANRAMDNQASEAADAADDSAT
jgi:ribonuclease HI